MPFTITRHFIHKGNQIWREDNTETMHVIHNVNTAIYSQQLHIKTGKNKHNRNK